MYIAAQILGVVILIISILLFLFKKKIYVILTCLAFNLLLGAQYLLLKSYTGAFLCLYAAFRYGIYLLKGKNKFFSGIWIPIFFVVSNIVISVFTFSDWFDIFPSIAEIAVCIYPWFDNVKAIKIGTLCIAPLWIVYDIFVGAWTSMLMEITILTIELVIFLTMEKHDKKHKKSDLPILANESELEENKMIEAR